MPRTATGTRGAGTTRRTALAATGAAAAGLLAACSSDPSDGPAARERAAAARAEAALRLTTSTASAALRDRYEAVAVRHPVVRPLLAPLHAEATRHVEALSGPRTTAAPAPRPAVPDDPEEALRELATAARQTSDAHTAALADAPPELARLLASVAAAGAVHAYLLTQQREGGAR
ncbi:hypothetical protein AB0G73_37340 [Streptomyces sp. NPDC020719]|uniref:hypothetical protein n=1 Tax=unclassified Streptomyces TaxID=2593676 RepID=UPI0033E475AD